MEHCPFMRERVVKKDHTVESRQTWHFFRVAKGKHSSGNRLWAMSFGGEETCTGFFIWLDPINMYCSGSASPWHVFIPWPVPLQCEAGDNIVYPQL